MTSGHCAAWDMTRTTEPVLLQPAYVLHGRPYRETSLLLEVFSAEHGRVALVARGVRGGKSTRAALLQPFRPLLLSWQGRGSLATVSEVEASGRALALPGAALISGFYLNELLMRLLSPHDPQITLFGHYDATLRAMAQTVTAEALENQLRQFELQLLDAMGYGLHLDYDRQSDASLAPDRWYCYEPELGFRPATGEGDESLRLRGATLMALAAGDVLAGSALREAKCLMRQVLSHYLGPKPLQSRELMRQARPGATKPVERET